MPVLSISQTWDGTPLEDCERSTVELTGVAGGWLVEVDAAFHGDPPPPAPRGELDGLWRFEVIELFVAEAAAVGDHVEYTEIELSPHGHHLILRFAGVRRRVERLQPDAVSCRIQADRWLGRIELPFEALPLKPWRGNAFAIHGPAHKRRYLAATPLPGEAPDFHQPSRFPVLEI